MKLSVSTAACPGLALDALDEASRARGLSGVELVVSTTDDAATIADRVRAADARVVAVRAKRFDERAPGALARISGALGVPLSVPPAALSAVSQGSLARLARVFADAGGTLAIGVGTALDPILVALTALRDAGDPASIGLAWELRPSDEDLGAASAVLLAARDRIRVVRLHGGGPEQHDQEGRGVGAVFVDLALSRYDGPVVLTPSSEGTLPRWREWLSSRKPTGCGSSHASDELAVDVRDVEPRDRLGTILGAYRAIPRGATLRITLDHDPSCMYYALESTEPAGTFAFRKIGDGPRVWAAEITKQ